MIESRLHFEMRINVARSGAVSIKAPSWNEGEGTPAAPKAGYEGIFGGWATAFPSLVYGNLPTSLRFCLPYGPMN